MPRQKLLVRRRVLNGVYYFYLHLLMTVAASLTHYMAGHQSHQNHFSRMPHHREVTPLQIAGVLFFLFPAVISSQFLL